MPSKSLFLLIASLILPATLLAENVMELRHVVTEELPGALKMEYAGEPLWLSSEVVISDADVIEAIHTSSAPAHPSQGKIVNDVNIDRASSSPANHLVKIKFSEAGAARFDAEAEKHQGKKLAIIVKGKVIAAPIIMGKKFGGTVEIGGNFTSQEAEDLAHALQPKAQTKP